MRVIITNVADSIFMIVSIDSIFFFTFNSCIQNTLEKRFLREFGVFTYFIHIHLQLKCKDFHQNIDSREGRREIEKERTARGE